MQTFTLFECETRYDGYGNAEDTYTKVCDINVAINFIKMDKKLNDIRYKMCDYTGLTAFKGFGMEHKYKLKCDKYEYVIKSINVFTRLTQLLLEQVIL